MDALRVENMVKSYGPVRAADGISFAVAPGEIFGLLGPNGAGKTTSIECIVGLRRPDSGSIAINGLDVVTQAHAVKQRIGVQLQATALYEQIALIEALRLFASFYRRRADVAALIERFGLTEKANARFDSLSGGQKQRLALALALVNEPDVLFLDEPTANLDPQSRRELHESIRQLKREGKTVILTTHYIEEAEQLCDRIAIVNKGRIIAEGTPKQLTDRARSRPRVELTTSRPLDPAALRGLIGVENVACKGAAATLTTGNVGQTILELAKLLQTTETELIDLHVKRPSVEDVYIELTGQRATDY